MLLTVKMAVLPGRVWLCFLASVALLTLSLQPTDASKNAGNVIVTWDILYWTGDGYTASVNLNNTQPFRSIQQYRLKWTWARPEVIYSMTGATPTEQGDCLNFPYPPPLSCMRSPTIIDLVPGVPITQQVPHCCRDGFIAAYDKDRNNSISSFSITVGKSGNTNSTVAVPLDLTLASPKPDYSCSPLKKVAPTRFASPDGKRFTQAYLTWEATCEYSK